MRRSHDAVALLATQECSQCGRYKLSHRMCPHCGYYNGRQIIDVSKGKKSATVADDTDEGQLVIGHDHDHKHDHDHGNCGHDHSHDHNHDHDAPKS
jgi:ribosomal protein L32